MYLRSLFDMSLHNESLLVVLSKALYFPQSFLHVRNHIFITNYCFFQQLLSSDSLKLNNEGINAQTDNELIASFKRHLEKNEGDLMSFYLSF